MTLADRDAAGRATSSCTDKPWPLFSMGDEIARLSWRDAARHVRTAGLAADQPHTWSAYVEKCIKCTCILLCFRSNAANVVFIGPQSCHALYIYMLLCMYIREHMQKGMHGWNSNAFTGVLACMCVGMSACMYICVYVLVCKHVHK